MKTPTIPEGDKVSLRTAEAVSADYALQEYGVEPAEMNAAEKRVSRELKSSLEAGDMISFRGDGHDFPPA